MVTACKSGLRNKLAASALPSAFIFFKNVKKRRHFPSIKHIKFWSQFQTPAWLQGHRTATCPGRFLFPAVWKIHVWRVDKHEEISNEVDWEELKHKAFYTLNASFNASEGSRGNIFSVFGVSE